MKPILISIKPKFTEKIYSGTKTIELRRSVGKNFVRGSEVFIYSSSPVKAITGKARIEKVETKLVSDILKENLQNAAISASECEEYFTGKKFGYLIWLEQLQILDKPVSLHLMRLAGVTAPQSFCYIDEPIRDALCL